MRNNNQILHGDQTRCAEKFLHGQPRTLIDASSVWGS